MPPKERIIAFSLCPSTVDQVHECSMPRNRLPAPLSAERRPGPTMAILLVVSLFGLHSSPKTPRRGDAPSRRSEAPAPMFPYAFYRSTPKFQSSPPRMDAEAHSRLYPRTSATRSPCFSQIDCSCFGTSLSWVVRCSSAAMRKYGGECQNQGKKCQDRHKQETCRP